MKPRSLLVRDRSRIGKYGGGEPTLLVASCIINTPTTPLLAPPPPPPSSHWQSTRTSCHSVASSSCCSSDWSCAPSEPVVTRSSSSSFSAAAATTTTKKKKKTPRIQSISTAARTDDWQQSHAWLIEFMISLIGGSMGAYVILFMGGDNNDGNNNSLTLMLSLLIPLILSEIWEFHFLPLSSSKGDILKIQNTKKRVQLRYGQGLLMNAGLAKILSVKGDLVDLLLQIPIWSAAWTIWTMMFRNSDSSSIINSDLVDEDNYSPTLANVTKIFKSSAIGTSDEHYADIDNMPTTTRASLTTTAESSQRSSFRVNRKLPPRSLTSKSAPRIPARPGTSKSKRRLPPRSLTA